MNENCKYCKTSKTCLENADYGSIYCQLHKKIPKVIGKTYDELQQENQQLKLQLEQRYNIINKVREILGQYRHYTVPDEKQNKENENIVDMALEILNIDKGEQII